MNYIIYDLEATCWETDIETRGKKREIIEIGALLLDKHGTVKSRFESFVQPIVHPMLSDFCQNLTTISQVDVNQADKFPEVIEDFQEWIGLNNDEEYLLCSWGFFDKSALVKDCKLHKLDGQWAKKHISLKDQYPRIKNIGRAIGMNKALEMEGFEFEGTMHRGIDDAVNLTKIFCKYLNLWRY
ncbi:MAG: 3'-5' exoribonuclease 1 [Aureispira sp.]|jgi:3'-5' exoribonuclease 1